MLKIFALLLFAVVPFYADATAYTQIEDKANLPVLTPSLAERRTEKIRLANGLEAYLISDPHTDKSAAALTVKVGSWSEPADKPGLAHFLEHMLFMGTKKYPAENSFDQFLSDHGGSTDAFTADDYTSFVFDVDPAAFKIALDHFSDFFKEPLFNPSGVNRELKAIDQEYSKNIENDDAREYELLKELSKPSHPFHRFSMGNSKTLAKVSREDLISWYKTHYSSNRMRLVVIDPEPLEVIRSEVITAFGGISNLNLHTKPDEEPSINPENLGKIAYIEPIKNRRNLNIIWELPPELIDLEAKPDILFCEMMGDEGPHSLLEELKSEGLADALSCGLMATTEKIQQLYIEIDLTNQGVKSVDQVIERVFQTIALMKQTGFPDSVFDNVQKLTRIKYQYQPRRLPFNEAMDHASNIAYESFETYPVHTMVIQKKDPGLFRKFLDYLTPQSAYYQLSASQKLTGISPTHKEPWMGVEYSLQPIDPAILKKWATAEPNPGIRLPESNPYIPDHLTIVNPQKAPERPTPLPITIKDDASGIVYYVPDTQFGLPQTLLRFTLKSPQVDPSAQKSSLADLYARYLLDLLNTSVYAATTAGLSVSVDADDFGIKLSIQGYSEKVPLLLEEVVKAMVVDTVDKARFERVKLMLLDDYEDSLLDNPYKQAVAWTRAALYKRYSRPMERAKALREVTLDKFSEFAKRLFNKMFIEAVLYGNLTEDEARHALDIVYKHLPASPYPAGKKLQNGAIILSSEKGPFFFEKETSVLGNALILTIENGPFQYKERGCQQIFERAIEAPFFNELRTRQQTGYIIANYAIDIEREMFSSLLVQSNTVEPRDLLARFELFLESYLQELTSTNLPKERFEKIRQSLIIDLQTPAKNQEDMADLLFKMAFKYKGDFDWIVNRVAALQALDYEECIGWVQSQFGRSNKRRLAIGINGDVSEGASLDYRTVNSLKQLRKVSSFTE